MYTPPTRQPSHIRTMPKAIISVLTSVVTLRTPGALATSVGKSMLPVPHMLPSTYRMPATSNEIHAAVRILVGFLIFVSVGGDWRGAVGAGEISDSWLLSKKLISVTNRLCRAQSVTLQRPKDRPRTTLRRSIPSALIHSLSGATEGKGFDSRPERRFAGRDLHPLEHSTFARRTSATTQLPIQARRTTFLS